MKEKKIKESKALLREKNSGKLPFNDLSFMDDTKSIIDEVEKETLSDIEAVFGRLPQNGEYTMDNKIQMILMMEVMQKQHGEKMVPKFTQISNETGLPVGTLYGWWENKSKILEQGTKLVDKMDNYLRIKLGMQLLRIMNAVEQKDLSKEKVKDLSILFSTFFNKGRLLGGQSTSNLAHKHDVKQRVQFVVPDED